MLTLTRDGSRTSPLWAAASCADSQPHSPLWLCPPGGSQLDGFSSSPHLPTAPVGSAWKTDGVRGEADELNPMAQCDAGRGSG